MQFTRSCTALLPAVRDVEEEEVEGAFKAAQAGADSREGRWLMVGQSAIMTTGAAGAASSTYIHHPVRGIFNVFLNRQGYDCKVGRFTRAPSSCACVG